MNLTGDLKSLTLIVGIPSTIALCLWLMAYAIRLAMPALLALICARHVVRKREREHALARMDREIELARIKHVRPE